METGKSTAVYNIYRIILFYFNVNASLNFKVACKMTFLDAYQAQENLSLSLFASYHQRSIQAAFRFETFTTTRDEQKKEVVEERERVERGEQL